MCQIVKPHRVLAVGVLLLLLAATAPGTGRAAVDQPFGVFVRLGQAPSGTLATVSAGLAEAFERSGWSVLAAYDAGTDDDCRYGARVIVASSSSYAESVLTHGAMAAFALPVRLAVYEDEGGVHVSAVDARSLTRTIISEDGFAAESRELMEELASIVRSVDGVKPIIEQYGQVRDVGLIAKTMGIMAGGPFDTKVETIATADSDDVAAVAERITATFVERAEDWSWGIRPVYDVTFPEHGIAIIGVSSGSVEARSFGIVGEGAEEARSDYQCPGVAHAAAYPIELVLKQTGDQVDVLLVDVMFRMKLYFEDAGTVAFATNMRMPGSIESEIRDKVEESLY